VDLAKKYPEKLAHLKALFEEQAQKHHLYPLITWDDVWKDSPHQGPQVIRRRGPETSECRQMMPYRLAGIGA
jgi:arylsulfatase